jgi:glyoxylase-like metal-dependent hydrolase (beta-lactamase superfamily II)
VPDTAVTEIAPGVFCIGPWGWSQTTVYLLRTADGGVLVDTGWSADVDRVRRAGERVLGGPPAAILLTHVHPDHSGAAGELARSWGCPVWLDPLELPIATGDFEAMRRDAGPLDRWVVLPVMRALGGRRRAALLARGSLAGVARTYPPDDSVPGLPGWRRVPTPGHTPGHTSFFRPEDGVLVSGDALVTLPLNSVAALLRRRRRSGPPAYSTWNHQHAMASIRRLAALEPAVLGGGHGRPLTGGDTAERVQAFADRTTARDWDNGGRQGRRTTRGGSVAKRRWQDLSPGTRRFIVVAGTLEGILKIAALVDLRRRPAQQIRGRKPLWATAIVLVNSVGAVPAAYFLVGRRKSAVDRA